MNRAKSFLIWLQRIGHCRGFGVQSPTDYAFVRYVVNERWPYYAYDELGRGEDWLTRKRGRLYFRLANWRQPATVVDEQGSPYWQAGCRRAKVVGAADRIELARLSLDGDYKARMEALYARADDRSLLVIDDIYRDWPFWRSVVADERTGVCFDLYYCGIVFFDKKRAKKNYIINF